MEQYFDLNLPMKITFQARRLKNGPIIKLYEIQRNPLYKEKHQIHKIKEEEEILTVRKEVVNILNKHVMWGFSSRMLNGLSRFLRKYFISSQPNTSIYANIGYRINVGGVGIKGGIENLQNSNKRGSK